MSASLMHYSKPGDVFKTVRVWCMGGVGGEELEIVRSLRLTAAAAQADDPKLLECRPFFLRKYGKRRRQGEAASHVRAEVCAGADALSSCLEEDVLLRTHRKRLDSNALLAFSRRETILPATPMTIGSPVKYGPQSFEKAAVGAKGRMRVLTAVLAAFLEA
ncbi:hypothetical protein Efla_006223 [Eimeria flavescens]